MIATTTTTTVPVIIIVHVAVVVMDAAVASIDRNVDDGADEVRVRAVYRVIVPFHLVQTVAFGKTRVRLVRIYCRRATITMSVAVAVAGMKITMVMSSREAIRRIVVMMTITVLMVETIVGFPFLPIRWRRRRRRRVALQIR